MIATGTILCLVTDRRRLGARDEPAACDALVAQAEAAAAAGIDLVQVREPDLDDRTLLRLVERVREAVAGSATRVLVNDRVDLALAAAVHGVHLRGSSYPARRARELLGAAAIVGRSVHAADEARAVDADGGVDYLIFGSVFPTRSKPEGHVPAGLDALAATVRACQRPVLAIGGVTLENVAAVAQTRARGVAAIGLFLGTASGSRAASAGAAVSIREAAGRVREAFADAGRPPR